MTLKSILKHYQEHLADRGVIPDPSQMSALHALGKVSLSLDAGLFYRLIHPSPKGIYLWGGVGRGKTLLMDTFFDSLKTTHKKRMHFHDFMHTMHRTIHALAGQANPLKIIAKEWREDYEVLCLDECTVDDVADALILGELLKALFSAGMVLVTTSNTHPSELYKNGVQRQLFLKAIEAIQYYCDVIHVDHGEDYRHRTLSHEATTLPDQDIETLTRLFQQLATGQIEYGTDIIVDERPIRARAIAHRMIWFDFNAICKTARSTPDYLALVKLYDTFFITHIPMLTDHDINATRRFVHLIDVLYDNKANLVLSTSVDFPDIYTGDMLKHEFLRTASRLQEMCHRSIGTV